MPDISANLSLPYIQPSQAQKHVTHNEGMRRLDALVHLAVSSTTQSTPPGVPQDGARFLLPISAGGAWAGQAGKLAVYEETAWVFYTPQAGWVAWVADTGESIVYDGTDWGPMLSTPDLQNLDQVGIQTTADATNRLAVASAATLLTHAGAGHQVKINKAGTADTASLLFQTNWSGRAEMGTTGSDDFAIKVSADGSAFNTAFQADAVSGRAQFPSGVSLPDFGNTALVNTAYVAALGGDLVANGTDALGNGYNFPAAVVRDAQVTPDLPAAFSYAGYAPGGLAMTQEIPVDPNQVYRLSSFLRQEGLSGDWSAYVNEERHAHSLGLQCLDVDGNAIEAFHHMRHAHGGTDSLTTLVAPLAPGDTVVQLSDASGWNENDSSAERRGLIIFGYRNGEGRLYDHYSRIVSFDLFALGQVDKGTHTVTLSAPLSASLGNPDDPSGIWPAGTAIANSAHGWSERRAFYEDLVPTAADTWYQTLHHIGGVDRSGGNVATNFPPGTARVRVMWRPNTTNQSGGSGAYPDTGSAHKVWFGGISMRPEPLAAQSRAVAGHVDLKVPDTDFASGSLSLTAPSMVVSLV